MTRLYYNWHNVFFIVLTFFSVLFCCLVLVHLFLKASQFLWRRIARARHNLHFSSMALATAHGPRMTSWNVGVAFQLRRRRFASPYYV